MKKEFRILYGILMIMVLAITTVGATYAYWTASTSSNNSELQTESTIYSISMDITPLYHGFSIIPMNDSDALKGIKNKCKDKYDRGACSAYTINVYGYNENLGFISGFMDVTTNNMQNLSYMMLRQSDTYQEDSCIEIETTGENEEDIITENYCVVKEATSMGEGAGLSLGDSYDVTGISSTKFILLIWLSNFQYSQNDIDIGSFEAIVTMQAGNGGQIKGSIASVIQVDPGIGDNNNENDTPTPDDETPSKEENNAENGA